MSKNKSHLGKLRAWAKLALEDPVLAEIAGSANSPTQAYVERLSAKPSGNDALAWHNLALREEGRPSEALGHSGDAAEYIAWKFGKGERPILGDWASVL